MGPIIADVPRFRPPDIAGLLSKTGVDPKVDLLTMGTVVFDPRTPNVAREITLGAGLLKHACLCNHGMYL